MAKRVALKRAQMRSVGLDVTVKSAPAWVRWAAPTWEIVMGHKNGRITDEQYTEAYVAQLERLCGKEQLRALYTYGAKNGHSITFTCFCADGKFCHTHILITWLVANHGVGFSDDRQTV